MNIQKIHLNNVKSYADETLSFREGINIIGGLNGAGKTTIIEAIGYCLFGKKPDYTFSEFVRRGEKDGFIEIWFEIDDIVYKIVRTFTDRQTKEWNIYDAESGRRVDLHGEEDIKKWLSLHLHLEPDDKLDKIFETVVGIEQGQFAAPFLQTDIQRKNYFEPILKLDKYRKAYESTASVSRKFNCETTRIENEIKINLVKIEKYDEKAEGLEKIKIKILELGNEIKNNSVIKEGIEAELERQENFKKKVDETQKEYEKKIINIESSEKEKNKNEEEIKESRNAYEIVEKTKPGKERFEELDKKIKELEVKQNEKAKLERQKNQLEKNIERKKTEISSKKSSFKEEETRLYKDIFARKEEIKKLEDPIKVREELLAGISLEKEKLENAQQSIELLSEWKNNLHAIFEKSKTGIFELEKKEKEIAEIKQDVSGYAKIEKTASEYDNINEQYENLNKKRGMLEQDIKTQRENIEKSREGSCPFLNEPCKNLASGNLRDYFENKIKEVEHEIRELDNKIFKLKNRKIKSGEAKETLNRFNEKINIAGKLENESGKIKKELESLYKIVEVEISLKLKDIKIANLESVCSDVVFKFNKKINENSAGISCASEPGDRQKNLMELINAAGELVEIKNELKKNISDVQARLRESEGKLGGLKEKKEGRCERIVEMNRRLSEIDEERKKLEEKKESLEKETEFLEKLINEIEGYGDVDSEILDNKKELARFRNDYNDYMSNLRTAEKLTVLTREKEKILKNIQELNIEKNQLLEKLGEYKGKYDEGKLNELKSQNKKIYEKLGKLNNELNERRNDEKKYGQEICEMDKIKAAINGQENELGKIKNAMEIFDFVRNVLNKIGPKIAGYYLKYISDLAGKTYRAISGENVQLVWNENYNIILKDFVNGRERKRIFKQLSGGEQMTAAIAVRLSILKQFSRIRLGFFDEPTTHLDEERRVQLAETIGRLRELESRWFEQLFIISHDDAFENITENIVVLKKDDGISSVH